MKKLMGMALLAGILLTASGCDTAKNLGLESDAKPAENAAPAAPAPPPFDPKYQEHIIFNDRYSTVKEYTYISPIDGKQVICSSYGTGVGAGTSCRTP
jgi:hypothetical protein